MYIRKTIDVYNIITNYGYGEEIECCEYTFAEAKQRKKEYLENARGLLSIRIEKKRIRK